MLVVVLLRMPSVGLDGVLGLAANVGILSESNWSRTPSGASVSIPAVKVSAMSTITCLGVLGGAS